MYSSGNLSRRTLYTFLYRSRFRIINGNVLQYVFFANHPIHHSDYEADGQARWHDFSFSRLTPEILGLKPEIEKSFLTHGASRLTSTATILPKQWQQNVRQILLSVGQFQHKKTNKNVYSWRINQSIRIPSPLMSLQPLLKPLVEITWQHGIYLAFPS